MIDNLLKWSGTFFTILGALATSFGLDPLNVVFFNIGSLIWSIAAIRMREPSLIAANVGLLLIYFLGFVLRFF